MLACMEILDLSLICNLLWSFLLYWEVTPELCGVSVNCLDGLRSQLYYPCQFSPKKESLLCVLRYIGPVSSNSYHILIYLYIFQLSNKSKHQVLPLLSLNRLKKICLSWRFCLESTAVNCTDINYIKYQIKALISLLSVSRELICLWTTDITRCYVPVLFFFSQW